MTKKWKPAFEVGRWVSVRAVHVVDYGKSTNGTSIRSVSRRELYEPETGQVVGIVYRYCGKRIAGCWDEPPHFEATKAVRLYKIATSWIGKPLEAEAGDIEPCAPRDGLPYSHGGYTWTERDRQAMRNESKGWERDSKGRWTGLIKKDPTP